MADSVTELLHRHADGVAGPEIIDELEDALLSIFPDLRWNASNSRWESNNSHYGQVNPNWFHHAATIPFSDEVHFEILMRLIMLPFISATGSRYAISPVTARRFVQEGLVRWLTCHNLSIPAIIAIFEVDKIWAPESGYNWLVCICVGDKPKNERIALINALADRRDFINELLGKALKMRNQDDIIQPVIDAWARNRGLTDPDIIYRSIALDYLTRDDYRTDLTWLVRWCDTSLAVLIAPEGEAAPHRPEMIADWKPWHAYYTEGWVVWDEVSLSAAWMRRWQAERVYRVLALMILLGGCDGELRVSDALVTDGRFRRHRQAQADAAKRFFRIAMVLPRELQEVLASVVVAEGSDCVAVIRLGGVVPEYTWRWALK